MCTARARWPLKRQVARNAVRFGVPTLVGLVLAWLLPFDSFEKVQDIHAVTITVAPIVFGILGAWVAVLGVSGSLLFATTPEMEDRLRRLWVESTFIFLLALVVQFFMSAFKPPVEHGASWVLVIFRLLAGVIFFLEVVLVFRTLMPIVIAERQRRRRADQEELDKR